MKKPRNDSFRDFVVERLEGLPGFRCQRMFGGFGLYAGDRFFGIIYQGRLYFRTSDETRAAYTAAGMQFFQPNPKQALKNYYEVPADILENNTNLIAWAKAAIQHASDV